MTDSVSLVRRKIEDSSLAFQDETVNSVVTLAAIEVNIPFNFSVGLSLTHRTNSMGKGILKQAECILTVSSGLSRCEVESTK